ncbi:SDR family oxidoreductase [Acidisoma sp. C75]
MARVLVTGGTGFIGRQCLLDLRAAGHEVRATLRDPSRAAALRGTLGEPELQLVQADLMADAGWAEAARGCDYVLHLASPFPSSLPRDAQTLIAPAREGSLRVLKAARDAGVRRVVLTSSFAAIGYGHRPREAPFTEADWTDTTARGVAAYPTSKTLAERAAWEFIAREGGGMELVAINPVAVFGPVLGPDIASSILIVKRLMEGSIPGCPDLSLGVVDVRDVADLHLRAMLSPAAAGERFLATAGDFVTLWEIAEMLRRHLGPAGSKVPRRRVPTWLMRLVGLFDRQVASVVPELGKPKNASSAKARAVLGWQPRSAEAAILATADSLRQIGLV